MAKKRKKSDSPGRDIARNRRATFDYEILDRFEAGIVLLGSEVKALREHGAAISDAYVQFIGDEAWLVGLHIPEYAPASINAHEPDRTRKLLLHRREIERLQQAVAQKSLAVVLISLYFNADGRVKARLGLGRGKTQYDKRQSLREREDRREADRAMKAARRR
ncbi:MAG: SsrA-binding protein SmpB [Thermoleophilia bacterium]|nr:SsrA-binding protein SmpB [Thermoleophilia bacterium]